jgi:hypothetical protein
MLERKSSALMSGSVFMACKPEAKMRPKTEWSCSWCMASSEGKLSREAWIACSSKPSGATKWLRRLIMRSMTKAKATTEQIKRGQIGQPAACMMVNKANTPEILCVAIMAQPSIHMICG